MIGIGKGRIIKLGNHLESSLLFVLGCFGLLLCLELLLRHIHQLVAVQQFLDAFGLVFHVFQNTIQHCRVLSNRISTTGRFLNSFGGSSSNNKVFA